MSHKCSLSSSCSLHGVMVAWRHLSWALCKGSPCCLVHHPAILSAQAPFIDGPKKMLIPSPSAQGPNQPHPYLPICSDCCFPHDSAGWYLALPSPASSSIPRLQPSRVREEAPGCPSTLPASCSAPCSGSLLRLASLSLSRHPSPQADFSCLKLSSLDSVCHSPVNLHCLE